MLLKQLQKYDSFIFHANLESKDLDGKGEDLLHKQLRGKHCLGPVDGSRFLQTYGASCQGQ